MCACPGRSPIRGSSTVCTVPSRERPSRMRSPPPRRGWALRCATGSPASRRPWLEPRARRSTYVTGGTLRLRSAGNAMGYLGAHAPALKDSDGFVETGDRVELRDGRYVFIGRGGGVINVGGLKVYPEEVEAIINAQPGVRMSPVQPPPTPT